MCVCLSYSLFSLLLLSRSRCLYSFLYVYFLCVYFCCIIFLFVFYSCFLFICLFVSVLPVRFIQIFELLDADSSGEISVDEIAMRYNAKVHPKVRKVFYTLVRSFLLLYLTVFSIFFRPLSSPTNFVLLFSYSRLFSIPLKSVKV